MQRKEVDSRHVRNVRPDSRPYHYHRQWKSATMGNYLPFISCTMKLDKWYKKQNKLKHRASLCLSQQVCVWGPADPLAQPFDWRVCPDYMTGHRGSTLSSCRGHDPLAQHYFRRLCPKIWLGIGSPQFPHAVDNSPESHEIVEPYFFRVSFPPHRDSLSEWA